MKAEIYNHKKWIEETDPKVLKELYDRLLPESGFQILNFIDYTFEPQGYTALWLLAESHFAVHTFPEENKSYIELSSCNLEYFIKFVKSIE